MFDIEQTIQTTTNRTSLADISLPACLAFAVLILATVVGNTLVLLALFLDKRLHSPSFFLIANMAIADLLLGKREQYLQT
jgi:histamine receptor H3